MSDGFLRGAREGGPAEGSGWNSGARPRPSRNGWGAASESAPHPTAPLPGPAVLRAAVAQTAVSWGRDLGALLFGKATAGDRGGDQGPPGHERPRTPGSCTDPRAPGTKWALGAHRGGWRGAPQRVRYCTGDKNTPLIARGACTAPQIREPPNRRTRSNQGRQESLKKSWLRASPSTGERLLASVFIARKQPERPGPISGQEPPSPSPLGQSGASRPSC